MHRWEHVHQSIKEVLKMMDGLDKGGKMHGMVFPAKRGYYSQLIPLAFTRMGGASFTLVHIICYGSCVASFSLD
jgi:hypothetical protein